MISTGRVEGHAPENLLMEIKGLKFAQNKTYCNCLCGAVPELLFIPIKECTTESINQMVYLSAVKKLIAAQGFATAVIKPLIQGQQEMVTIIEATEEFVILYEDVMPDKRGFALFGATFQMLLQLLEDAELVSEEAFEAWIEQREDTITTRCSLKLRCVISKSNINSCAASRGKSSSMILAS